VSKDRKVKITVDARRTATDCEIISLTECNSGTTENLPFGFNTAVEMKNMTTTSDITGTIGS
jgi:hypothetical protein